MTVIWWVAANVALYLQLAQPVVPLPPGLMIKPEYSERRAIHVLITDNIKVCQPSLGGSCVGQAHNGICKLSISKVILMQLKYENANVSM